MVQPLWKSVWHHLLKGKTSMYLAAWHSAYTPPSWCAHYGHVCPRAQDRHKNVLSNIVCNRAGGVNSQMFINKRIVQLCCSTHYTAVKIVDDSHRYNVEGEKNNRKLHAIPFHLYKVSKHANLYNTLFSDAYVLLNL